jgi:hypothetical protein
MAIPREIRARRGDWILPRWLALLRFIDRTSKIVRGAGVRVQYLPSGGIHIFADDNFNPWTSPFKVRVTGTEATVREGTVNGVVPAIGDIRLDGTDADGAFVEEPKLEVEHLGGSRSFIALKLTFTEEPVEFDAADPQAAQIVHVEEVHPLFTQGGAVINDDNSTLYPLASIAWKDDGTVRRSFQIVHHNLNHRFVRGSASLGKPSRHLFWSA